MVELNNCIREQLFDNFGATKVAYNMTNNINEVEMYLSVKKSFTVISNFDKSILDMLYI